MLIDVYDGPQLLEARECRLAQLADGRQAAIYRGLAFPLLTRGGAIDVSGEAHPPVLAPAPPRDPDAAPGRAYAVITGADAAYVLLAGSGLQAEGAAAGLREAGFDVVRTGRYLGEPVDGFVADWFVRIAAAPGDGVLEERLGPVLGAAPAAPGGAPDLRSRLLSDALASAREQQRRAEGEVDRLRLLLAERGAASAEVAALRDGLAQERRAREIAEANARSALDQLGAAPAADPSLRPAQPRAPRRVLDEIHDVLAALLPRVRLLRDGLNAVAVEFSDRRALYRVLAELQACDTAMPERWKTLQAVGGWIEKSKVANGVDSKGRVYARLNRTDRSWEVLVSHKSTQDHDIDWLRKQ